MTKKNVFENNKYTWRSYKFVQKTQWLLRAVESQKKIIP